MEETDVAPEAPPEDEMKAFGRELAKNAIPKKPRKVDPVKSEIRKINNKSKKFHKQNPTIDWAAGEKPPKPVKHMQDETQEAEAGWRKVKFNKETFVAAEAVVLVRTTGDAPLALFMSNIKNVTAYTNDLGELVLRPARAGSGSAGTKGLPTPEEAAGEVQKPRRDRPKGEAVPALTGTRSLNPAKENSKRFYVIEAMLENPEGLTAVEIVRYADKLARKGGYQKGAVKRTILATTKNIREVAEGAALKITRAGKEAEVKVKGKKILLIAS